MADIAARLTTLTRLGFAARGLLYIVIALLVLTTGRAEDPSGALQTLGEGGGRILLGLMAAGFVAYGIWRLSDAAFDIERHGSDGKGLRERLGAGASGIVHLFLAWQAIRLMQGTADQGGSGAEQGAQSALQLPGGGVLLVLGGLVLLGVGLFQLYRARKGSFLDHLEPQVARQDWVRWTGRAGYAARGLVFLISGFFLVRAGLDEKASEAGGMAEALAWLTNPWDVLVAIGLLAFGLFSLIEARFRTLHQVPVHGIGQKVRAQMH
ncbi:DUF1206 domain-containing protein [Sphingomonas sp. ID1715]|uniref:DUF1206 domain-containing protein n=1 Tax=Sphingomonas sp. ID1715 TaxID=1656898 RepID=UPI001489AD38|nr:DUF1206 domain-containing protein [Sphingomonas sp. ID1715]NNM77470.1 DUF1206 domain-containing protein [Sphingomonas sp. ID1715]